MCECSLQLEGSRVPLKQTEYPNNYRTDTRNICSLIHCKACTGELLNKGDLDIETSTEDAGNVILEAYRSLTFIAVGGKED